MKDTIQTNTTKKGLLKIKLTKMPNQVVVDELNKMQSISTFMLCQEKGYARLLVRENAGFFPPTMEAPINQWFRP